MKEEKPIIEDPDAEEERDREPFFDYNDMD